jgi:diacylglycerol kinase (ATP)
MQQQKFSIGGRRRSFYYAGLGIWRFLRNEHNAWIHIAATILVIVAGILLKVSRLDAAALAAAIGLVWVAEIFNTCLEQTMDIISRERHPRIGFVKDLAAGAVLVAAITALVIGLFVFIPHIL